MVKPPFFKKIKKNMDNVIDDSIKTIESMKFDLNSNSSSGVKVGLTNALDAIKYIKQTRFYTCDCGCNVEDYHVHTNSEGNTTCSLCLIEYFKSSGEY